VNKNDLLCVYFHQRDNRVDGSIYKNTQCDFAYNSNHMEGSKLTEDQTRMIYERNKISGSGISIDDITETKNHFIAFDFILDTVDNPLTNEYLCHLHGIVKANTKQATDPMYAVGGYKKYENTIGDVITTSPDKVIKDMETLLDRYEHNIRHDLKDIIDFHFHFETIHPFSDGNGRVGRLIMFKECLRHDVIPFIITDDKRDFYIRGLRNYPQEKGWLTDTCLYAQDIFIAKYIPLAQSYLDAM